MVPGAPCAVAARIALLAGMGACVSTIGLGSNDGRSLRISPTPVVLPRDGVPVSFAVSLSNAGPGASLSLDLPQGVILDGIARGGGAPVAPSCDASCWVVTVHADPMKPPSPGALQVPVRVVDGPYEASDPASFTAAVVAAVAPDVDVTQGLDGKLVQFMSTSFQPAPWQANFFTMNPDPTDLANLNSHHIHIQAFDKGVPWQSKSSPPLPSDWDFSELDAIMRGVAPVGDASPLFQIAVPPAFVGQYLTDANFATAKDDFVAYCAYLVKYYNGPGFTWGGQTFRAPFSSRITWWGILGDYNVNALSAENYAALYRSATAAMLAVDPGLRFSSFEYSDYVSDQKVGPTADLSTFLAAIEAAPGAAPYDVVSLHMFSTNDLTDTDRTVFASIPSFAQDIKQVAASLRAAKPASSPRAPVWITQNNVNSDVPLSDGTSLHQPSTPFVDDLRGTSSFFEGWRPFVFSQFAKAGSGALYHWDYTAGRGSGPSLDLQSAEVSYDGERFPSYFVDYWLGRMYPWSETGPYPDMLTVAGASDQALGIEVMATRTQDGAVLVLIADIAPEALSDVNGVGAPRTVIVDVSRFAPFGSASLRVLDRDNDPSSDRAPDVMANAGPRIVVTLAGYGVAFLKLVPL